eukprot:3003250-Prymnesium_polylepis.1
MEARLSPSLQQMHKAANAVHDVPPTPDRYVRTRDDREKTRATHPAHGEVPNDMDMVCSVCPLLVAARGGLCFTDKSAPWLCKPCT